MELVRIEAKDGINSPVTVVGLKDQNGETIFLPVRDLIVDEDGQQTPLAEAIGVEKVARIRDITPEEKEALQENLNYYPPLLATHLVFNLRELKPAGKIEGTVKPILGIFGPPQVGKTIFLLYLMQQNPGKYAVWDMDKWSPESLTATLQWAQEQNMGGENMVERIKEYFAELAKGERQRMNEGITLRQQLDALLEAYKNNNSGKVTAWLLDLPGMMVEGQRVTEKRELDAFDWLWATVQSFKVWRPGPEHQDWDPMFQAELFEQQGAQLIQDSEDGRRALQWMLT